MIDFRDHYAAEHNHQYGAITFQPADPEDVIRVRQAIQARQREAIDVQQDQELFAAAEMRMRRLA